MPRLLLEFRLCLLFVGLLTLLTNSTLRAENAAPARELLGKTLVFSDDFESGNADRWQPTDANAWKVVEQKGNHVYNQFDKSKFQPPVRSPFNRSLLKDVDVGSFVLDVKLQSTHPDYGHRDMCLFFGYQDDAHLYYVHLGKKMDPHANNVFIVNGEPRKSISTKTTPGTNWDDEWHHVRVVRNVESGSIEVYFDDMKTPVMTAQDKTFLHGRVGIGTFDDTGNFDDFLLYGDVVDAPKTQDVQLVPTLPGTAPLLFTAPLHEVMVSGIDRFALRAIESSAAERDTRWKRDYSNAEAYAGSVSDNRERLRTIVGAVDPRVPVVDVEVITSVGLKPLRMVETPEYTVIPVRWSVLEDVTAEGLLLHPETNKPRARVVALPDADWTPETFAGLSPQSDHKFAIPLRLVRSGCQVLIPTLISRDDKYSGNPQVAMTNQPHREFIYRMAFEMGRHIIGYEVQKVLAAVDAFTALNQAHGTDLPIGVLGVGEGGLVALHSAALDTRIDAVVVSGYFQKREGVWEEPIYRNVWAQLTEFGDAEIASLIAPRPLIIEAAAIPNVDGPPAPAQGRRGGAAPGKISTPPLESVQHEFAKARVHYDKLGAGAKIVLTGPSRDQPPGGDGTLTQLVNALGINALAPLSDARRPEMKREIDEDARQKRQFDELVEFTQELLAASAAKRDQFWSKASRSSVDEWTASAEFYRDYVWEEMIGKLPAPTIPPNVRTRKVLDAPEYTGYEVAIDVYPDVIAGGILILPTNMQADEKRPVVVCQHGLEGTPMSTIESDGRSYDYYKSFSVELAKRGFITYAPQNPYIGMDKFRTLQRKSNPMKRSLFSYIIRQHERTLEWLATLPNVDPARIAFYGLSYGGKTAVRVPPILKQYCLSICSADFDEWILKNVTNAAPYSYMFTGEYEMVEWNMGHTANYAELSTLMTPRPFMVERGHFDGVAPDEWVAWEYAKVRRHYDILGLGDRTEIEFFTGPHCIHGVGTYAFLHKHLNWPAPSDTAAGK